MLARPRFGAGDARNEGEIGRTGRGPCAFEGSHRQGGEGGKQEQGGGGEAAIAAGPARSRRRAASLAAPVPTGFLLVRRPCLLVHARAAAATIAPRVERSRADLPPAVSCPGP